MDNYPVIPVVNKTEFCELKQRESIRKQAKPAFFFWIPAVIFCFAKRGDDEGT